MLIKIKDYFDLRKIAQSGQCFRVKELEDGIFRFVSLDNILYIKQIDQETYSTSCTSEEWNEFWYYYFDLDTNYKTLCYNTDPIHPVIQVANEYSKGIRILRQDPWETLISFIISQNKNIPAIKRSVENLSLKYGVSVKTPYEQLNLFPDSTLLKHVNEEDLRGLSLGYRAPYLLDAIKKINQGEIDLKNLKKASDETLLEELEKIKGVGIKVASCTALFGYHRTSIAPVDVWIKKVIEEDFKGISPFEDLKEYAGFIQQFLFFYKRNQ